MVIILGVAEVIAGVGVLITVSDEVATEVYGAPIALGELNFVTCSTFEQHQTAEVSKSSRLKTLHGAATAFPAELSVLTDIVTWGLMFGAAISSITCLTR
eukprot:2748621-Amphidinium_carterae.1